MTGKRLPMARETKSLSAIERRKKSRKRLPSWFRTKLPTGKAQLAFNEVRGNVLEHQLNTVCQEAQCPNIHDCWGEVLQRSWLQENSAHEPAVFVRLVLSKAHHPWM